MENINTITKKNGIKYSIRSNRDRFFYPNEWVNFYDHLKPYQQHTFKVLINTGARINEARNIKKNDIDLINQRIVLRVTKVKAKKGEKNPRPRIIPISSHFRTYLKRKLPTIKGDYIGILSTPAANICLKKTLERIGIQDYYMFSIHNIRKTLECYLMALDIDGLKIVSHFGHTTQTAAQHYISPDVFSFEEKKTMRLIIGDLYQKNP